MSSSLEPPTSKDDSLNDNQIVILTISLIIFLLIFLYIIWLNQGSLINKSMKKRGRKKRR